MDLASRRGSFGNTIKRLGYRILAAANSGATTDQIAERFRLHPEVVALCVAHLRGDPLPGDPTPEQIAEECRRIRSGEVVVVSGYQSRRPVVHQNGEPRQRCTRVGGQTFQARL